VAKKRRTPARPTADADLGADLPVVGLREPCPCGSGRRYKACHGRALAHAGETLVRRPFAGLPGECDWVAMREIVPAATASVRVAADGRTVTLATVLPMAWPGFVRTDGAVFVGLQTRTGSGDPSRDVAATLVSALQSPAGTPIPYGRPAEGPRLQDLLDLTAPFVVELHDGFDFWLAGAEPADGGQSEQVRESMERANAAIVPTVRLGGVEAAYWCRIGSKEHLRWVLPYDEEPLLDALARLRARHDDGLGPGTRLIGTFRALGVLVPVWDLAPGTESPEVEEPAQTFLRRLEDALAQDEPLTSEERNARAGLANRQVTLR
jgi:hypothetical protein